MAHAAGSPPALYVNEESRVGALDTPFPLRPTQRLAPPSTLRRPSDFIQFSSPAPFWKMEGLASTPFKPYDFSPVKTPFSDQLKKTMKKEQVGGGESVGEESEGEQEAVAGEGADGKEAVVTIVGEGLSCELIVVRAHQFFLSTNFLPMTTLPYTTGCPSSRYSDT